MKVISTKELVKVYQSKLFSKDGITALDNFTFDVEQGEIFGLLGPNGAGKTTLIKILLGIVLKTSGDARVFESEVSNVAYKKKVGYLPENHRFPNYLTGEQVIRYFGKLSGFEGTKVDSKIDTLLEMVKMKEWRNVKIKKYSKGMMQRIGIAQALVNNPELIFLDEPTDGVDPMGRKERRDLLLNLKSEGKTIFLNSHLLSEVELICDKVAILNKGKLLKTGSVDELTSTGNTFRFFTSELNDKVINYLLTWFKAVLHGNSEFTYNSSNDEDLNKVIDYLRQQNVLIRSFYQEKSSLESMFINLIGQEKEAVN